MSCVCKTIIVKLKLPDMNSRIKLYLFTLVCFLLSVSCNKEEQTLDSSGKDMILQLGTTISTLTRASDNGFDVNDKLGLYIVKWQTSSTPGTLNNSSNYENNALYSLVSSPNNWQSEHTIYYPSDDNKIDIYSYYPYRTPAFASGTTISLNVNANQSNYQNYTQSDFMVAKTTEVKRTPAKVQLTFNHRLSQIVFQLIPGSGFTANELLSAKVTVINAITDATYDLAQAPEGEPVQGATRSNIFPCGSWKINNNSLEGVMAILVPQTIDFETYIQVLLGNRKFTFKPASPITLSSGCSRKFTITVNNTGLDITTTINPWNTCPTVNGNAEEEFEEEDIWDGTIATSYCGGTGKVDDPYLICSGAALAYFSQQVNDNNFYTDNYFKLTSDLNMNNIPFTPIGNDRSVDFRGHFDGGGHIIKNLKIISDTRTRVGLFSVLNFNTPSVTAEIKNLGLQNAYLESNTYESMLGGIAGEVKFGKIENCFFKGEVINNTSYNAAGICGYYSDTTIVIRNCYAILDNLDANESGSIVGGIFNRGGVIENCYGVVKKWRTSGESIGNVIGAINPYDGPLILKARNNYYDKTVCSLPPAGKNLTLITVATGKTTDELKSSTMLSTLGDAFKQDKNNINEGYPILEWQ